MPNDKDSNLTLSSVDVDLGNYREIIYNHEIKRNLSFYFEFYEDYFPFFFNEFFAIEEIHEDEDEDKVLHSMHQQRSKIISMLKGQIDAPTKIAFELTKDLSVHKNIKTTIFNEKIGSIQIIHRDSKVVAEDEIYLINANPTCSILFADDEFEYVFDNIDYVKQGFLTIIDSNSLSKSIEKKLLYESSFDNDLNETIFWRIGYLLVTQNFIQVQLAEIEYINPLLSKPADRIYLEGDKKNTRRTKDVKDLVDFLSGSGAKNKFADNLSKVLTDLGIANRVYLKQEGFTRELRIVINGVDSNIKDVGYGVSLQLPIFAQAIISENTVRVRNGERILRGETLLIEQPEVHLHPNLQAKFIDALLQIGPRNRYIIETHSEHIVRMLQIIVKEKRYGIKASDVSITYLKKQGRNMIKTFHAIDSETGKLKPVFPKGFYDVSYNLAFELMD